MSDQPEHPPFVPTEDAAEPQAGVSNPPDVRRDSLGRRINSNSAKGLAAMRGAKTRQHMQDLKNCAHWAEVYKDERNSTQLMAKKMGVTIETIRAWRRELGIALAPGRPNTLRPPEEQTPKPDLDLRSIFVRKWSALDLFDRLMAHFKDVDVEWDEDDEDKPEAAVGDYRETWVAWRVCLAAIFGIPKSELLYDHSKTAGDADYLMPGYPNIDLSGLPRGAAAIPPSASIDEIFERCTGRTDWPKARAKRVSLVVGRRGGKSYVTAAIGIFLACCHVYSLNLGTKGLVMVLARDRKQAGVIRNYVLTFIRKLEESGESILADQPTQDLIDLRNGVTIEVKAVGDAGTRGYTTVAVLADEIAFWSTDEDSVKQDKKVLQAIKPSIAGVAGSMIVMLSSPYARRGELYIQFREHYGKENSKVLVWNADTFSMRPEQNQELIDWVAEAYEDDPESASAEYGGRFRSDLENIFGQVAVDAVCVPGREELPYDPRKRYRAFVDPSGGSSDSYTLAIAYDDWRGEGATRHRVPVLVLVREFKAPFKPNEVSAEIVMVLKRYRITSATGDAYAGEWPREPLKSAHIRYEVSEKHRSELYLDFVPLVNSGRCELLDGEIHKRMVSQLVNLERRVGRSGKDSVDHPPGGHDDVANAVAGVMVSVGGSKRIHSTW